MNRKRDTTLCNQYQTVWRGAAQGPPCAVNKGPVSRERQTFLPWTAMHPHLPVFNFCVGLFPSGRSY